MQTLRVEASGSYDIIIGEGLLAKAGKYISDLFPGRKAFIVSDDTVYSLYGEKLEASLKEAGIISEKFVFPHGEQSKSLKTYGELLNAMCEARITRGDIAVALGGGVVGDMCGFAAATYLRGISFVQIPTTLLAAVDSSVGGKTGVDLDKGKNQVGAFYQPSLVLCDTKLLYTLPDAEYRNGCAEIIKYAMIGSKSLFREISEKPVCLQYENVIAQCVAMKRDFVEKDERDLGCRMMLNFGHTLGHAIETCSEYAVPHGKAVAIGMAIITKACVCMGAADASVAESLEDLLDKYGLPKSTDYSSAELINAALADKKISGGKLRLVVPASLGQCVLKEIDKNDFILYMKAGGVK